ncbi:unnamed protein product [Symbiodinium sp. CCMP2592]|nr:unnamed protein product [Symbiodinium sp. CCMP2592]
MEFDLKSSPRAKNTATAKDICACFVIHFKNRPIDIASFREADTKVVQEHEALIQEIVEKTLRPTVNVLRDGIMQAFEISKDDAQEIAKKICSCFVLARSKMQSTSTGKKLEPALWRLVQRLKSLSDTCNSSPKAPSSKASSHEVPSTSRASNLKKRLLFSPERRVRRKTAARPESAKEILSVYGLNRTDAEEEVKDADVELADEAGDVDDFGVIHDSQSEIEICSSENEEPAAAKTKGRAKKAYFDPAAGCYIRLNPDGQEVRGELSEGPEGFCMVRFPSEMPFQSEVPNLWLAQMNEGKKGPKLKRARGKAKAKAKGKCKQSSAPEEQEAPDSEAAPAEESPDAASDSGPDKKLEAARPANSAASDALLFQGYDITGMPEEAQPPADASGKHSYTVRLPDGIAIDVLVRNKAFWIKKPTECRSQYSWSQYDNLADAWSLAAAAAIPVDLQIRDRGSSQDSSIVQLRVLDIFFELGSSAAMLSKSQRDAPEALQDIRMCPKCGTRSYLRKRVCINILCQWYYMRQEPNTNLWARGPIQSSNAQTASSGSLGSSSMQRSWSWTSWKNSGYADGVYQNKLEQQLQDVLEEEEADSEEPEDPEVQVVAAREGDGPRIEEVVSSDEEANAFIFGLEKKNQVSSYSEYEEARHAWESASQEHKAGHALRSAIKMEKEHSYGSYGSEKAASAAQVALEEGQKWQRLQAKGAASERFAKAVEKRRFVPVKAEPPVQDDPYMQYGQAPVEEPSTGAGDTAEQSTAANEQSTREDTWGDYSSSYGRGWKSGGRKQQSSSSWERPGPQSGRSQDAMQKYNEWEEFMDKKSQAYWGSDRWQRDYASQEQQQSFKKSKGKKRKLWLASQIETLKQEGRWVGGAPSESSKKLRLIREAEAKQIAGQGARQEGGGAAEEPAAVDAGPDEAQEEPGSGHTWQSFRSMVEGAETIEHVIGLDEAYKHLKNNEAETQAEQVSSAGLIFPQRDDKNKESAAGVHHVCSLLLLGLLWGVMGEDSADPQSDHSPPHWHRQLYPGGKGPQNSKMAKAMAAKSKAAKAKVKHEKQATPKRKAKAAKVELGDAGEEDDDSTAPSGLGYARGTISAALTGLRYQLKAKKTTDEEKQNAQKVLEEYEAGDIATKREILSKVSQFGVRQCNWVHDLVKTTVNTNSEHEDTVKNWTAIFKLEGIDESGLEEDMKKDLLEELMSEAEKRYGYERSTKIHPKFEVLSKYFYVHSKGQVARQATKTEESLGSHCSGMKNLQLKDKRSLDIMLGKSAASSSSKDPALQPSQSHTLAKDLLKKIVAEKRKLTQNNEELKSLKTKISTKYSGDKTWDNRKDDVDQAIAALEDFLGVLRQHEAESVPADVTSDCTELVATFHTVVYQAANHDKGSKALLKKVNGLME